MLAELLETTWEGGEHIFKTDLSTAKAELVVALRARKIIIPALNSMFFSPLKMHRKT